MQRVIGWLAAAIIVTFVFGSAYFTLQQLGRRAANDAPTAAAAAQVAVMGFPAPSAPRLELTPDSGVFVIVYGADNQPMSGTATLHGTLPVLPAGVLEAARRSGSDAVSWQPEPGLRIAVVARPAGDQVVVAGQSLKPTEDRNWMVLIFLSAAWLGSMIVLALGYGATEIIRGRSLRYPRLPMGLV
ncbi:hypothetical protein QFZ40_002173 [Arthrobacter pascens]|uniref:hypothetical protein n=1 Tax=Arthrobacter pascens TaxID=1677 RepID=UPI0027852041|nr:hypothetical protein [Arthrobacter pascens]MDQ0634264.1 hypothetical protein [Arthrobacter pascens]